MNLSIYAVLDKKAGAYMAPFTMQSDALAARAFVQCFDANNRPAHEFAKWPEDYDLYRLGHFDDQSGELQADQEHIMTGLQGSRIQTQRQGAQVDMFNNGDDDNHA